MCGVCGCGGALAPPIQRVMGAGERADGQGAPLQFTPVAPLLTGNKAPGDEALTNEALTNKTPSNKAPSSEDVPSNDDAQEQHRLIHIERDIRSRNDRLAAANRARFSAQQVFAINLLSSPGSGKTTLLERTLRERDIAASACVIEGDQQTRADAERIAATGVAVVQINTGTGCHLDARQVAQAAEQLPLVEGGFLFIENVGNLVCPSSFDLGEALRVVVLSITEGEDKPLKYPDIFVGAQVILLNKMDLLPHLDFDLDLCLANLNAVNPHARVLTLSARRGEGLEEWFDLLRARSWAPSSHCEGI